MDLDHFLNIDNWKFAQPSFDGKTWAYYIIPEKDTSENIKQQRAIYLLRNEYLYIPNFNGMSIFPDKKLIETEFCEAIGANFYIAKDIAYKQYLFYFEAHENINALLQRKINVWKKNYQRNNFLFQMEDMPCLK